MPLTLPSPVNATEAQAYELLRALDSQINLMAQTSLGFIMQEWFRILFQRQPSQDVRRCAAFTYVKYRPVVQNQTRWVVLCMMACTDPARLTENAVWGARWVVPVLNSLHAIATSVRPPTLGQFKDQAEAVAERILPKQGWPQSPLLFDDLQIMRSAYHNLVTVYYAP